ncbi:MAG: hypothetical protein WCP92_10135 [bacterium]
MENTTVNDYEKYIEDLKRLGFSEKDTTVEMSRMFRLMIHSDELKHNLELVPIEDQPVIEIIVDLNWNPRLKPTELEVKIVSYGTGDDLVIEDQIDWKNQIMKLLPAKEFEGEIEQAMQLITETIEIINTLRNK